MKAHVEIMGIAPVHSGRRGDCFKKPRKVNGKPEVFEGLDLVQWHIDRGNNDQAKELLGKVAFEKLVLPELGNVSLEFSSLSEFLK